MKKWISLFVVICLLLSMGTVVSASNDADMTVSDDGVLFIKQYEGFSDTAYAYGDKWYIGYGTVCEKDAYPDGITEEEAMALLQESLKVTETQVNEFLTQYRISCNQSQFDALVSFTYTLGTSWMEPDYRLTSCLIDGVDHVSEVEFVDAMVIWSHVGDEISEDLIERRIKEAKLFLYGDYGDGDSPSYTYLILDSDGGSVESDIVCYEQGEPYGTLPEASRTGCDFEGWYTKDGVKLLETDQALDGQTVTAQWKINTTSPFQDVQPEAWYYSYVVSLYQKNVIDGFNDGLFHPEGNVTCGQALKLILTAANYGEQAPTGTHWASGYLATAEKWGIVAEGAMTDLNAPATRLEIAQVAAAALELGAPTGESPFADTADPAVVALYEAGVLEGSLVNGQRVYRPDAPISRAEISKIIWKINQMDLEPHTISYGDETIDVLPGVAVNRYDKDAFAWKNGRITYTAAETKVGVDVSQFQGEIDWNQVKKSGVDYAMVRVGGRGYGNGMLYEDSYYEENLSGAAEAGLDVGVYFFSQAITPEEAREEAQYVLERIEGYDITYPVVFDWEEIGSASARTDHLDADTLAACAQAFCQEIEQAGYEAMLYVSLNTGYRKYDLSQVTGYDLWLAEYADVPTFYYDFQMWQYTDTGSVPGIEGDADLNISFRDYSK
jgi:uncharacterized repeat protein (TIGR02543 family)